MKKNLFYLIALVFFISSCSTDLENNSATNTTNPNSKSRSTSENLIVVGSIVNGEGILTYNSQDLRNIWSNHLNANTDLTVNFTSVWLEKVNENQFVLRASDHVNAHNGLIPLQTLDDDIILAIERGEKIVCSGCKSTGPGSEDECTPELGMNGRYYCTSCSKGECSKTVTVENG